MKAARAGHLCTVQFLISKGTELAGEAVLVSAAMLSSLGQNRTSG